MSNDFVLAVDLGGTNLRFGVVDAQGRVLDLTKQPSPKDPHEVLKTVIELCQAGSDRLAAQGGEVVGISLGFPGIVDPRKGIVHASPHFPEWQDLAVVKSVQAKFSCPVRLDNDANLIALGERWRGAGRGLDHFILMTLGTGLGGAIVSQGELCYGESGFAGELGHMVIDVDGPPCHCGGRGCLEMFVSATGLKELMLHSDDTEGGQVLCRKLARDLDHITAQDLSQAALDGDSFAHGVFRQMGRYLGVGIASIVNATGIFHIVIGGGILPAADFFLPIAQRELAHRTYKETASRIKIHRAQLGDEAGLIGGASKFLPYGTIL